MSKEDGRMRWEEFRALQPKLADLGRQKLGGPGVVLVATTRRDGTPRLSPVEPLFWRGDLWLSMGWRSQKALDLERDPRILVHNVVVDRQGSSGEYKLRGHARPELDPSLHQGYADTVARQLGWRPEPGRFHLFRVDVEDVTFIRWDSSTNDQYVSRWPPGHYFVRRGTSATSVGDPEPVDSSIALAGP
jgi:pyridoxamine 5'-phosphate oxidase-like protein